MKPKWCTKTLPHGGVCGRIGNCIHNWNPGEVRPSGDPISNGHSKHRPIKLMDMINKIGDKFF